MNDVPTFQLQTARFCLETGEGSRAKAQNPPLPGHFSPADKNQHLKGFCLNAAFRLLVKCAVKIQVEVSLVETDMSKHQSLGFGDTSGIDALSFGSRLSSQLCGRINGNFDQKQNEISRKPYPKSVGL